MLNTERIQIIAEALDELNEFVVYVGGAVVEMYVDDPATTDIRPTMDIDCVTQLDSRKSFWDFEERLRRKGFINDQTPGAPICRWEYKGETVDVMPDDPNILGFSNRWYHEAMSKKKRHKLPNGRVIYIFDDVYFLATKIEAVNGRGGDDWRMSHDFEDTIYLLNYSTGIFEKIKSAPKILQEYVSEQFAKMLKRGNIREEVECALPYDEADRVPHILGMMHEVAML